MIARQSHRRFVVATIAVALLVLLKLESHQFVLAALDSLMLLATLLAAPILLLIALRRATWWPCRVLLVPLVAWPLGFAIARWQEATSRARGDGLAQALQHYHAAHGHWPAELDALVPTFLPALPHSAMGVFGTAAFTYTASPDGQGYELRFPLPAWMVCVRTADGAWRHDD